MELTSPKTTGLTRKKRPFFINHDEPGGKEFLRKKILKINEQGLRDQRQIRQALIANDDWFDLDFD
jgi:hypothetical protein